MRLVKFLKANENGCVWVNPLLVRAIIERNGKACIIFDDGEGMIMDHTPQYVADQLKGPV